MSKILIKIPEKLIVIYSNKRKFLIISKFWIKKMFWLKTQICVINQYWTLFSSNVPFFFDYNKLKLWGFNFQKLTISLIKWTIIEIEMLLIKQLKFIGVGYKVFKVTNLKRKALLFKIGYSHFLYYKILSNVCVFCLNNNQIFVYGNSFEKISYETALIWAFKVPEPYKNKGISYKYEN